VVVHLSVRESEVENADVVLFVVTEADLHLMHAHIDDGLWEEHVFRLDHQLVLLVELVGDALFGHRTMQSVRSLAEEWRSKKHTQVRHQHQHEQRHTLSEDKLGKRSMDG
jgi:hypothetical protein